jgi:hypothetical protein
MTLAFPFLLTSIFETPDSQSVGWTRFAYRKNTVFPPPRQGETVVRKIRDPL